MWHAEWRTRGDAEVREDRGVDLGLGNEREERESVYETVTRFFANVARLSAPRIYCNVPILCTVCECEFAFLRFLVAVDFALRDWLLESALCPCTTDNRRCYSGCSVVVCRSACFGRDLDLPGIGKT